jgi:two-component system, OmpR family, sensor histidine kinase ChvG
MRLRAQLLLVSALTLALPWAGCQYVREMERAQRSGVEDALLGSAAVVASALATQPDLLYPYVEQRTSARDPATDVYAIRIEDATLDGYPDAWLDRALMAEALSTDASTLGAHYAAGVDAQYLYLYVHVTDDAVVYLDPVLGTIAPCDRLQLAVEGPDGYTLRADIATAAPGPIAPLDTASGEPATRIRGHWQTVAGGYQVELRVPLGLTGARFGFRAVDADGARDVATAGTLRGYDAFGPGTPGLLTYPTPSLAASLQAFAQPGKRLRVTDKAGFELGAIGELGSDGETTSELGRLAGVYRTLLARDPVLPASSARAGLATTPGVRSALAGRAAAAWYRLPDSRRAVVAASQPIRTPSDVLGAVVIEQTSAAVLTLTNRALVRLVNVTLLASLLAAAALLGYATWLSLRIRRLRNAAERALDARGRIAAGMPGLAARDEVGDLARAFTMLLERLREHTEYLRTLASKLSHELRTPLAVVQSSLENLAHQPLDAQANVYASRAQEGAARLRATLAAMSEATRVEQAIEGAQLDTFDLAEVVRGAAAAYRDVYRGRRLELEEPGERLAIRGSPELVVQMLDKLVENAVDFTPPEGRIGVSLRATREACTLAVANEGPPLPARMQGSIFDSLVSVRERRDERPHLGLGLHIARLIADAHGAAIEAHDSNDGRGVEFSVRFPRA